MGELDIDKKLGEGAMVWVVKPILQMPTSFMPVVITVLPRGQGNFWKR